MDRWVGTLRPPHRWTESLDHPALSASKLGGQKPELSPGREPVENSVARPRSRTGGEQRCTSQVEARRSKAVRCLTQRLRCVLLGAFVVCRFQQRLEESVELVLQAHLDPVGFVPCSKRSFTKGLPHLCHQVEVKVKVVLGR